MRTLASYFIGLTLAMALLPQRGVADRVQLQATACAPSTNADSQYSANGVNGVFNTWPAYVLTLICPIPSDDGGATDIGDAFDYLRDPTLTVHVRDDNDGASVVAYACYTDRDSGAGSCGSGDSSSSAGRSFEALTPATTVWTDLADGTNYPAVMVELPDDDTGTGGGQSYLVGYTVVSD